jgi:uncharacterized protein (TIGR03435 family)
MLMRTRLACKIGVYLTVSLAVRLHAQDGPHFEVASVKAVSQCTFNRSMDPERVALTVPLTPVLISVFGVNKDQIIGPSWLESDCFEIIATLPKGSTTDQIPAMLRALLADRFKLTTHKESRPGTVYALMVDKNGPKLKEAAENSAFMGQLPRNTRAFRRGGGSVKGIMTMGALAQVLSNQGFGPIVDATGLKGEYEVNLSWVADPVAGQTAPPATASDPLADLFAALRDSLGLRLEARKSPSEVLVIDHIERVPTGN